MRSRRTVLSSFVLVLLVSGTATAMAAADAGIVAFNKDLDRATRRMDNAATLALWDEEAVSLLPATPPIVGKKAIAAFLDGVTSRYPGGKMKSFEMQCHDITVSGDWASEWCTEHQVVTFPGGGKPFDGQGTMLLVLHRSADGKWRIRQEMWTQGLPPDAKSR